jgi:tetratricopeptide (TPR) repeat protein
MFKDIPVIMITAVYKGWENARIAQETHGADAFVEKPFDVNYLRQLVARMVGKALPRNSLTPEWAAKVKALREEAEVHYNLNDFESCDEVVKQWRALDPFDAHPLLLSGNARLRLDDLEGAMKAYERACAFDGTLYPAFLNLAGVYEKLGFQQRAAMAWYRAYELAPDVESRRRIEEHLNVGQNR